MSMKNYPLNTTAFWIDQEVTAYIYLNLDQKNNTVPEEINACVADDTFSDKSKAGDLPCGYSDISMVSNVLPADICFCSEFAGEITSVFPEKAKSPIDLTYDDDYIAFIEVARVPNLFQAAYESPDALLREFQEIFADNGIEFPGDFDWWAHIVTIKGTFFC